MGEGFLYEKNILKAKSVISYGRFSNISANLGTKEDPLIVRMGITTQAYSLMKEMLENEPKPVSNERWNKIMLEASKRYPPEKNKT